MIRLNTTLLFCLAVPLKPTLSSPTLWLSAATAVHAELTLMSAHTEPAWMEQSVPSLLGVSTHILATATMLSLFDSRVLVPILSILVVEVHDINILRKHKRHHIVSDLYRLYLSQLYQLFKFCLC